MSLPEFHQVLEELSSHLIIFKVTPQHACFITLNSISSWLLSKPLSFTVLPHTGGRGVTTGVNKANGEGRIGEFQQQLMRLAANLSVWPNNHEEKIPVKAGIKQMRLRKHNDPPNKTNRNKQRDTTPSLHQQCCFHKMPKSIS